MRNIFTKRCRRCYKNIREENKSGFCSNCFGRIREIKRLKKKAEKLGETDGRI